MSSKHADVPQTTLALAIAVLGICVIRSWDSGQATRHGQAREVQIEACEVMKPVAASLRNTSSEMAASDRKVEMMYRDSAISLASHLAEERASSRDVDAAWISAISAAIADTERFAVQQQRSAEKWDQLAVKASADLATISDGSCWVPGW